MNHEQTDMGVLFLRAEPRPCGPLRGVYREGPFAGEGALEGLKRRTETLGFFSKTIGPDSLCVLRRNRQ